MPETTAKSPHDMTVAELQAEIGYLQAILHRKVCGDPMGYTQVGRMPTADEIVRRIEGG